MSTDRTRAYKEAMKRALSDYNIAKGELSRRVMSEKGIADDEYGSELERISAIYIEAVAKAEQIP